MAMQYASTSYQTPRVIPYLSDKPWSRFYQPNATVGAGAAGGAGGSGGGSNLTGATAAGYSGAYGGIPQVPSPGATAESAIASNIANFLKASALAASANKFNQGQLLDQYRAAIPNYNALVDQRSNVVGQQLAGDVPDDVLNQIIQGAAERGILTGSPGSPNANAAYLRALGLTSIGQQQSGLNNLATTIQTSPVAAPMDVSSMFTTPEQWQAAQMAANTFAAAPIPSQAAAAARNTFSNAFNAGQGAAGGAAPAYTGYVSQPAKTTAQIVASAGPASAYFTPGWNSGYGQPAVAPATAVNPWASINPEDYRYAEGSNPDDTSGYAYDYASMFADAGQPYVDYRAGEWADYDWSQYE